jgi:uncharacterized RmlC-like cupin family protein
VIEGEMVLWFGDRLERKVAAEPGDFLYVPSGIPHLVVNGSATEPVVAVLARTDANEQEDVTELPTLDTLAHLQSTP